MDQFVQDYLPYSSVEREDKEMKDPRQFGSELASKLLKGIDRKLSESEEI